MDVDRFCPACNRRIEDDDPIVFFRGEMYHVECVPRSGIEGPGLREPRY